MDRPGQKPNALVHESSPYLLQHAHNPVDWHPWNEQAWAKAVAENKLVIVSVGYAACHWCHVMERETFENIRAAELMNKHFVCIKVDREERPDVDQIYMDAVQLMTGQGGWPLNCVTLPDGRPIWGGTYFPTTRWLSILMQLQELWEQNPQEAEKYGNSMLEAVMAMDDLELQPQRSFQVEDLEAILLPWRSALDKIDGGPNRAPKFPLPNNYLFLIQAANFTQDQVLNDNIELTLRKMAHGGIYDQLGGGFARYSVDSHWKVPHFEKMAYDNGQLVSLYAEAFRRDPQPLYKRIVEETLEWVRRDLTSPEGAFYSSLDADSEGEEGKFYVWRKQEIIEVLGADADWFCDCYQVTEGGNWEHGNNILLLKEDLGKVANQHALSLDVLLEKLEKAKTLLLEFRNQRIKPGLDNKILASWNAILLKGYTDAYRAFHDERYLRTALRNAEFIESQLRQGKLLFRTFQNGQAKIHGFLDDYALVADAYIGLFLATMDEQWLTKSRELVEVAIQHFLDSERKMFFYTSDLDAKLIARKLEVMDNVIPGSNSVMAHVLHRLGTLLELNDYTQLALQMLENVRPDMPRYGSGYSNWGMLMLREIFPRSEVVVTGPNAMQVAKEMDAHYSPNWLVVGAETELSTRLTLFKSRFGQNETRIYVCKNQTCHLPVTLVQEALELLKGNGFG
jgi:uncharacterized protein YyaL (SSP411 family)